MKACAFLALGVLLVPVAAWADAPADDRLLTVERIFDSGEFHGGGISATWLKDGTGYVTVEPASDKSGGQDIVRHDPGSGKKEILIPAELLTPTGSDSPLGIEGFEFSPDMARVLIYTNSKRVWRLNTRGDYWMLDRTSRELRKLGGDARPSTLRHARFSPRGDKVAYAIDRDLYIEELEPARIIRLTRSESPDVINGGFDWVYEEEFYLRDGFRFSPDGTQVAYWQLNTSGVSEFPLVNETDSLYPAIRMIKYPKAGELNSAWRIGIVPAAGGQTQWLSLGQSRDNYVASMTWDGPLVVQKLNRLQNQLELVEASILGNARTITAERDPAWVDVVEKVLWFKNHEELIWTSEADGWRRLHRVKVGNGARQPITPAGVDVIEPVHLDESSGVVYYTASPQNATQAYLYKATLDGKKSERVTPSDQPGTHHYQVSPDGRFAIHTVSRLDTPPTTDLIALPSHRRVRILAESQELQKKLAALKPWKTEFFQVDIGDGVKLDAWALLPAELDARARGKHPLLVHVYGEPAAQTVLDRWSGPGYLWHAMLAQQGYVVVSIDNRGTPAPRGRAWRKSIYKRVGINAPMDQAAAVRKILTERPYLDPNRVGVWGWSGGGSMTLHAMFKFPELYKVGISIAPVPNQRLYDTIYQERYMALPKDNVEGYTQGSPVNFAGKLQGKLLVIHGTGDDNCHYQGTEQLLNELIRQNRPFSMMAYPNRSHSISEGRNTTLHLRKLMTRYLLENLPASAPAPMARAG